MSAGNIIEVIGAVVDVEFPRDSLWGSIPSAIRRERSPRGTLPGRLAPASDGDARSVSRTEDSRFATAAMLEAELCGDREACSPTGTFARP